MSPGRHVRAPLGALTALMALLALSAFASAQPYAADGGFGAPYEVGSGALPVAAVAAGDGAAYNVWADAAGVLARKAGDDEPVRIAESDTVRGAWATVSQGELAVTWVERDRSTGRTLHWLSYRGEDHLLFEHTQETPLLVGPGADGPWIAAPLRQEGEARLSVIPWSDGGPGEPQVLYATTLSVRGMFAVDDPDPSAVGPAWISWLEGFTEMTAVGLNSEWHAYVLPVGADAEPVDLGLADVRDERQTVAIGLEENGDGVYALWRAEEADLQATLVEPAASGGLSVTENVATGVVGRPLAWVGRDAYWLEGPYIKRGSPFDPDTEPIGAVWSPELIADAALSHDATEDITHLAWYGRRQGGAVAVFASDDTAPFEPTFVDRLAATMGWSPYDVGQEAAGQALTAVIVGVIGAMAASPVLFLLSLVVARIGALTSRPVLTGALLGVVVPPLLVVALALRVPSLGLLEPGPFLGLIVTLVIGAVVGYLLARGADREPQLHILVSSVITVLVGLTLWSFAYYRVWAPFVGL